MLGSRRCCEEEGLGAPQPRVSLLPGPGARSGAGQGSGAVPAGAGRAPLTRGVSRRRMLVYSGDSNRSAVLYDSLRADSVPFEGVISDGSSIRIDFLAEEPAAATAFNIRFEGDPPVAAGPRAAGGGGCRRGPSGPRPRGAGHGGLSEPPVAAAALGNIFPSKEQE